MKRSLQPNKAWMGWLKIKVLFVVFFGWKGMVHHEFVPRCQMVNKELYQEILVHLRDAVCRKRSDLWENQTCILHHDNVPAHVSLLICSYLAKHRTTIVSDPPYPPDLAPTDFFLFPKLKTTLKGCRFQTIATLLLIRRTACAHSQFSGCSSTTNAHNEMGQMAVCCQNLTLGALSSYSTLSLLIGALFKKFGLFLNTPVVFKCVRV
jgi:hypothetical protein